MIRRHLGRTLRRLSVVFNTAERCVIAHKLIVTFSLCSLLLFLTSFSPYPVFFFVTHSARKCTDVLLNIYSGFTLNTAEMQPQTMVSWTLQKYLIIVTNMAGKSPDVLLKYSVVSCLQLLKHLYWSPTERENVWDIFYKNRCRLQQRSLL